MKTPVAAMVRAAAMRLGGGFATGFTSDPIFLEAEGAAAEPNDDFDPLDHLEGGRGNDAGQLGYWISDEQERELEGTDGNYPAGKDWKDVL